MKAYGVIDGLTKTFDDADLASRVHGSAEYDFLKQVGGEMLGARKSQKITAGVKMFQSVEVKKLVSTRRGRHVAPLGRQRGRVEHDHVEGSAAFLDIGKGVALQ